MARFRAYRRSRKLVDGCMEANQGGEGDAGMKEEENWMSEASG